MHSYEGHVINYMKPTKTMHLEIPPNYRNYSIQFDTPKLGPMTHDPWRSMKTSREIMEMI